MSNNIETLARLLYETDSKIYPMEYCDIEEEYKAVAAMLIDKGVTLQEPVCDTETGTEEPMRHFSTGAVRDDATGKGRYDLMPWGAIHALAQHCERGALHYGERNVDKGIPQHSLIDSGLRHLSQYIQGDVEPYHLVAALWNIAWAVEQEIKRPEMVDLPERTESSGRAV